MSGHKKLHGKLLWQIALLAMVIIGAVGTYVKFPAFGAVLQSGVETTVTMEVTYGYGDIAKGDRYLPVQVALENQNDGEFSGNLEILLQESSMEIYRYQYPVTLGPGKQVKNLYHIPLGIRSDQLYVTLKDEAGNEVNKKRVKLNISKEMGELMVGALCDTPDQLLYLDQVSMYYGTLKTRLIPLEQEEFPRDFLSLDMLDVLLITNYNSRMLDVEQQKAIEEWVLNGGTLLFGTGQRVSESLGDFAADLVQLPIEPAVIQSVNLGVEYAEKAPGDSVLELACADLTFYEGNQLMSGDQMPLLTAVSRGRGKIAVAAYDFVDIAGFCNMQPSYVEKIMTALYGQEVLSQLAQTEYYGYSNQYWSVQSLVNSGSLNRLPNVLLYTVVILIYVIVIGPGLYFILKHKGMQQYYLKLALLLSICLTGVIYVMGYKTRFQSSFFTYATVLDTSSQEVTEQTYINVRTPNNDPYSVEIAPEYTVRPITKSYYYEMQAIPKFTGNEPYKVGITQTYDQTILEMQESVAFTPKLFYLSKNGQNVDMGYFDSDVTLFDGVLSGTVTNHFSYPVQDCTLILYGRMVMIGDLEPGQTKDISGMKLLNTPLGYTYVVSQMATGADRYEKVDINDPEYVISQDRADLLSFYMYSLYDRYNSQARVVGFSSETQNRSFIADGDYETGGVTMVTSLVEIQNSVEGRISRTGLMKAPNLVSGSYQASYNMMMGVDPLILEYALGNDLDVEQVSFEHLSPEFTQNKKYSTLVAFSGKIYAYNYDTRQYDLLDTSKTSYQRAQLLPYLSPTNQLTIKYVYEGGENYQWDVILPMISVIGREK